MAGSTPATALATIRAIGRSPSSRARDSLMTSTAAAPSLMPELLPAVTEPEASRLNAGLSVGERLQGRVRPRMLVGREGARLAALGDLDRNDLIGEATGVAGRLPALLGGQREGVLVLAADAALLDDVLGGLAHRVRVVRIGQARVGEAPAERRVVHRLLAAREGGGRLGHHQRGARHRLDAAGDEDRSIAVGDGVGGADDRLQARAAEAVDGLAGDPGRQAGEQRGHAADVAVVLARLVRRAEDHVVDRAGVDARSAPPAP